MAFGAKRKDDKSDMGNGIAMFDGNLATFPPLSSNSSFSLLTVIQNSHK